MWPSRCCDEAVDEDDGAASLLMMLEKKRTTFISILTCKVHPENTEKQPFEVYEANHQLLLADQPTITPENNGSWNLKTDDCK